MKPEKSLFVRLSLEEHAQLKAFANGKKVTMSDFVRGILLEKINGEASLDASILETVLRIKEGLDRVSLVSDAALIAACRYHPAESEDLAGLNRRRSEALVGAKNRLTQNT